MEPDLSDLRKKIAREAATLLYRGIEKEYKQAKQKAAQTLGLNFLPSNREVATELDSIAEENEGASRDERLVCMRKEALKIMKILKKFKPKLVGSVWRGAIHRGSDIDVVVYCDEPQEIVETLQKNYLRIVRTEEAKITEKGRQETSFHIYLRSLAGRDMEVVVRSTGDNQKRRCEIYGDAITGLNVAELEKILAEEPTRRFIPSGA